MEEQLAYRSTIKSRPFLYIETKKLAELIIQDLSELEIKEQVIDQNIFQVKSETRKKEIASTILKRLNALDNYLIHQIVKAEVSSSKLIVLFAILKTDRLFYEFMNEVFHEKVFCQDLVITDRDFNVFFESKRQQSETVAKWKEYTFYKLQQVYSRILFEAGLLKNKTRNREVIIPFMNPDILDHIRDTNDARIIDVIVGGN